MHLFAPGPFLFNPLAYPSHCTTLSAQALFSPPSIRQALSSVSNTQTQQLSGPEPGPSLKRWTSPPMDPNDQHARGAPSDGRGGQSQTQLPIALPGTLGR
ncbi:hypothetical protein BC567DRAFT_38433 [Phyllosticta citribraziliensis]